MLGQEKIKFESILHHLAEGARKKQSLINLPDVFARFVELRGGEAGLAKLLSEEYDAAPPGSLARTRIMSLLFQAWKMMADIGREDDAGLISDKDLERELSKAVTHE